MKKNWNNFLIIILVVALYIRVHNLNTNFTFSGEFGDNLLDIKNYYFSGSLPLVGPPTSHPWLYFGPLYFWMMMPIMVLFHWQPYYAVLFGSLSGVFAVWLNWYFIKKLFNPPVALYSSALLAVSPLVVAYSRIGRFYFLVVPLFYIFYFYLISYMKRGTGLWPILLSVSIMFSFHYSPLIFIPAIVLAIFIKRKSLTKLDFFKAVIAFVAPLVTLIFWDMQHGFSMISKFALWIPYRLTGFIGLYPKNNGSAEGMFQGLSSLIEFLGRSFAIDKLLWGYLALLILFIFYTAFISSVRNKDKQIEVTTLLVLCALGFTAFLIHGDAPIHYLLPIFPVPFILVGYWFDKVDIKIKSVYMIIFFGIMVSNYQLAQTDGRYFGDSRETDDLQYAYIEQTSIEIISDSADGKFTLNRVGKNDQFEGDYAQNYIYVMWLLGNEPVNNAKVHYTIYEDQGTWVKKIDE